MNTNEKKCNGYHKDVEKIKKTPIQNYYTGKNILVTGATGFLGKVIIERLFKACWDLDTIYIMIRAKKGRDINMRFDEFVDFPIFSELPKCWRSRVVAIEGQLGEANLKLSQQDRDLLIAKVNIVFHCAATVKFDENLKIAIAINSIGTKDIITLCREMKNLEALIHVSTAYSYCDRTNYIKEEFYPSEDIIEDILPLGKFDDEGVIDIFTRKVLNKCPNTYIYTKALAENIIKSNASDLPVAIFRPGVVVGSSAKHSVPGFIDNFYGPTGLFFAMGAGVLRVVPMDVLTPSNLIPVDYCANVMLIAAWDLSKNRYNEPPIYNFVPNYRDNPSAGQIVKMWENQCEDIPLSYCVWYPGLTFITNKWCLRLFIFLTQLIPSFIADILLTVIRKQPMLMKAQRKILQIFKLMKYFFVTNLYFQLDGVAVIRSRMSKEDLELFYTDMTAFKWNRFLLVAISGARLFLLKENTSDIPRNLKNLRRLKILHHTMKIIFYVIGLYAIASFLHHAYNKKIII